MLISVEDVERAVQTHSLTLIRGKYREGDRQVCPLGALYLLENGSEPYTDMVCSWAEDKFGEDFSVGFVYGVDNIGKIRDEAEYLSGYENGQVIREAFFGETYV